MACYEHGYVGWVRRLGCGKPHERRWQRVAESHTEADCWSATESARRKLPWCCAEWAVLRHGEKPETALRRR
jgi:hypothetical protein